MSGRLRPVVLVWLLLTAITTSLLLRALWAGPAGTAFVGTFFYVDDFFNYLSFVEQAQHGVFLFRSKLVSPALPGALVNVEWLAVGWFAALLGGRAVLAYRLFGIAVLGALVMVADRWLVRCGLPVERRLSGLLLVFTGGGLGGLLYVVGWLPGERALDLRTGAFPFVEAVANPHFLAGTALLAAALLAFAARRPALGAALGCLLVLVRPYDAVLLTAIEVSAVVLLHRPAEWPRRLLPVATLLPFLAYSAWLFLVSPGFRVFSSPFYAARAFSVFDLALALGPAVLLALFSTPVWRSLESAARAHMTRLLAWVVIAVVISAMRPVSFSNQILVGVGLPLLLLAAVGIARLRPTLLTLAVPPMATSALVVAWLATIPSPTSHPPVERWLAAEALRGVCRSKDLVLAPPDIGLYVGGLTRCWPFVSHAAASDHGQRARDVTRLYDPRSSPAERSQILADVCPDHIVLPPALPKDWLGTGTPYAPTRLIQGPRATLAIWSRVGSCRAPESSSRQGASRRRVL